MLKDLSLHSGTTVDKYGSDVIALLLQGQPALRRSYFHGTWEMAGYGMSSSMALFFKVIELTGAPHVLYELVRGPLALTAPVSIADAAELFLLLSFCTHS